MIDIGKQHAFGLREFRAAVFGQGALSLGPDVAKRLNETRRFIDYVLENNIKIYGVTTGFADLRSHTINPSDAAELSCNLIHSHDAGIGASLHYDVVLGAMIVRAVSLAKGHSGFQLGSLNTLLAMIEHRIVPLIPKTGSLGASGDLAFLARIGRAMMGESVPVHYQGNITTAGEALRQALIPSFSPKAKEGLAMTNGTAFMISGLSIAYIDLLHALENIFAMQGLFLNSVGAIDAAFNSCLQAIRKQQGQAFVADLLQKHFRHSPFIDFSGMQDDYCIRCLPQLLGSKVEVIMEQFGKIERELDAVTDNPLLFKDAEISPDVAPDRVIHFEGGRWAVLSGGNFHGECLATVADVICAANAKIAITLERQITYMLNPFRNKQKLPTYLIADSRHIGMYSGYMITQYTANALTQKIAQLGVPTSIFNITSANESEDVVSYGASAAQRLLEQVQLLKELNSIYLCVSLQAYALARQNKLLEGISIPDHLLAERIFQTARGFMGETYPYTEEKSFEERYQQATALLATAQLCDIVERPLYKQVGLI